MAATVLTTVTVGSGTITNGGLTFTDTSGGTYSVCVVNNAVTGKQTWEFSSIRYFVGGGYIIPAIGTNDLNPNSGETAGSYVMLQYVAGMGWMFGFGSNGTAVDYVVDSSALPGSDNSDPIVITFDVDWLNRTILVRLNGVDLFGGANPVGNSLGPNTTFADIVTASPSKNFFPIIIANSGTYGSLKFSSLTYAPKTGYSEYDALPPSLSGNNFYGYLARDDSKRYFEIKINDNVSATNTCVGIVEASNTSNYIVLSQTGNIFPSGTGPSFTSNNTITIAIDFTSNKVFFGKDATPNTSAAGISITPNTNYVPVVLTDATNVLVTLNEGD